MRPPLIPQPLIVNDQDSKLTKLFKNLFNSLVNYREPGTGRIVISVFMCLPSRKDFPKYFDIIKRPISMYDIRKRIDGNLYSSEEACLNDFKLMFSNCRTFNEDGSQIFEDSIKLEKIVLNKYNESRSATQQSNGISRASSGIPSEDSNSRISALMNEDSMTETLVNNNHDVSMDSTTSLPEKPIKRLKRDHDLPKKRVLTGYIIYAAEVRKDYVDKNPNQDFGYISRLIGNDWKALSKEMKQKYEQRAVSQNAIIAAKEAARLEQAQRTNTPTTPIVPPMTKKQKLNTANKFVPTRLNQVAPVTRPSQPPTHTEAGTQTTPARFVRPPNRMFYNYVEIFKSYLGEELDITCEDVYKIDNNFNHYLDADAAERWLGSGLGRHKTSGDALWALRDFMLQDSETMRWSLQPYQQS